FFVPASLPFRRPMARVPPQLRPSMTPGSIDTQQRALRERTYEKGRGDWGHAVTRFRASKFATTLQLRGVAKYACELAIIGVCYFVLAKAGLTLASIYPSAVPIWPAAGFALAAVLLRGLRVWPAIFAAAFFVGAPTGIAYASVGDSVLPSLLPSLGAAAGATLEAVVGGSLLNAWSQGRRTFDTAAAVAKFALVGLGPSTMIGALVGAGSIYLAGAVDWANLVAIGVTWWLRDAAGAAGGTPVGGRWAGPGVPALDS